jgi:PKD repeat protein
MLEPVGPSGRRDGRAWLGTRQRRAIAAATALMLLVVLLSGARAGAEPPVASFTVSPAQPLSGETIVFASAATGTVASQSWDLDGDGRCNDAAGPRAERGFAVAGTYPVKLCVDGPEGEASQVRRVTVLNRPPMPSFTSLPEAPVAGEPSRSCRRPATPTG